MAELYQVRNGRAVPLALGGEQLLTDSVSTADSSVGASAAAVKTLNDAKFDKAGGQVSGVATFGAGVFEKAAALSGSAIDLNLGSVFTKTVTEDVAFSIAHVPPAGSVACFTLILTNGGSRTVTWPASFRWADGAPPLLSAAGTDVLTFMTVDGGAAWYGVASLLGAA